MSRTLESVAGGINTADKILANIVPVAENVVDKVRRNMGGWGFETMLTTPISSYCMIEMANWQLYKHLYLSWAEKGITLDMIADSATGISNKVSDEFYKYDYLYTMGNNYVDDYQRDAKYTTTRAFDVIDGTTHRNNYGKNVNVYPDEDNTGNDKFTDNLKWNYYEANRNKNSIINKTKQLFDCRKINTIISRFHTDPTNLDLYDDTEARTEYGLSHGRNLLTYDAEHNGISYDRNGYDNPYCRVWTHHHQYSQMRARLMRPFTIEDENGNIVSKTNQSFHNWSNFPDMEYVTKEGYQTTAVEKDEEFGDSIVAVWHKEKKTKWGWKDSGSDGWAKSVLNRDTGLVNIAPKFLGGAEKNIHTKDCMFSIENLAWQGYDPYSFERALSWEQRGPFGGRIMWFPPYGLRFSEDSSVNWNEHSFIGRGENVYTYANTTRSGTLEFMMVVDHPSILDYSTWYGQSQPDKLPKDTDIYRFFAGCDGGSAEGGNGGSNNSRYSNTPANNIDGDSSSNNGNGEPNPSTSNPGGDQGLSSYARPTPLTDEYLAQDTTEAIPATEVQKPESPTPAEPEIPAPDEEIELTFYVFYPNNYSGYYDNKPNSDVNPIAYLLYGKGAQYKCNEEDVTKSESLYLDFKDTSDSTITKTGSVYGDNIGEGYEMNGSSSHKQTQDSEKNFIIGTNPNWAYYKASTYMPYETKKWYYRIDGEYKVASGGEQYKNTFDQTLLAQTNYLDNASFNLNCSADAVRGQFKEEQDNENLYSLAEVAYALKHDYDKDNAQDTLDQLRIKNNSGGLDSSRIEKLIELFDTSEGSAYKVIELHGVGYSNSHGNNANKTTNDRRNDFLAEQRCVTALQWFKDNYGFGSETIQSGSEISYPSYAVSSQDKTNASGNTAKKWRSAKITIKVKKSGVVEPKDMNQEQPSDVQTPPEQVLQKFIGFKEVEIDAATNTQLYVNINESDPDKKERRWYYDETDKQMKLWGAGVEKTKRSKYNWKSKYGTDFNQTEGNNTLRYDQEYHFFKQLEARDPDIFDTLVKKLQYFDPAFHSMTPEGFMGRLNFLQQCTRQGATISASDEDGHSANNLAFGRPPFCILRLGDFYYQKIVIKNVNITYDPLVLDLNNEGIGVVPLIANVTISFNFIGGGDLSGPVRRLQSAMSFNYYANGRLYDNRADRVEREKTQWDTMGAMGHHKVDFDESYFHSVQMAK